MEIDPSTVSDDDLFKQIRRAHADCPEMVERLLSDFPAAAEPVNDYITDLEERGELFA